MAMLLRTPERDAPDVAAAIAAARDTLTRLGARPFLHRLDRASSDAPVRTAQVKAPDPERASVEP